MCPCVALIGWLQNIQRLRCCLFGHPLSFFATIRIPSLRSYLSEHGGSAKPPSDRTEVQHQASWRRLTVAGEASEQQHLVVYRAATQAGAATWSGRSMRVVWPPACEASAALLPGEADTQRAFRVDCIARSVFASSQPGSPVDASLAPASAAGREMPALQTWYETAQAPQVEDNMPLDRAGDLQTARLAPAAQSAAPPEPEQPAVSAAPHADPPVADSGAGQEAGSRLAVQMEKGDQRRPNMSVSAPVSARSSHSSQMPSGHGQDEPAGAQLLHTGASSSAPCGAGLHPRHSNAERQTSMAAPSETARQPLGSGSDAHADARSSPQLPCTDDTHPVLSEPVALPSATDPASSLVQQDTGHAPPLPPAKDSARPRVSTTISHAGNAETEAARSADSFMLQVRSCRLTYCDMVTMMVLQPCDTPMNIAWRCPALGIVAPGIEPASSQTAVTYHAASALRTRSLLVLAQVATELHGLACLNAAYHGLALGTPSGSDRCGLGWWGWAPADAHLPLHAAAAQRLLALAQIARAADEDGIS